MATKLKNMKLTSVDLVRAGANQEADICLYKSADPAGATESPVEEEKSLFKRFVAWLRENPAEGKNEPQIAKEGPREQNDPDTFKEITAERTANEILDLYLDCIEDSIESIQLDDTLSDGQKKELLQESLQEFTAAMEELVPKLSTSKPEKEHHKDIAKSEELVEITEVTKYNHNHGADEKFTSGNGGGGKKSSYDIGGNGTSPSGRKQERAKIKSAMDSAPEGSTLKITSEYSDGKGSKSTETWTKENGNWTGIDGRRNSQTVVNQSIAPIHDNGKKSGKVTITPPTKQKASSGSTDVTGSASRNRTKAQQIYEKNPGSPMSGSISGKKVQAAVERGGKMHTNEGSGKSYLISPQNDGTLNVYVGAKTKSGGLDITENIRGIKTAEDAHAWARGAVATKKSARFDVIEEAN